MIYPRVTSLQLTLYTSTWGNTQVLHLVNTSWESLWNLNQEDSLNKHWGYVECTWLCDRVCPSNAEFNPSSWPLCISLPCFSNSRRWSLCISFPCFSNSRRWSLCISFPCFSNSRRWSLCISFPCFSNSRRWSLCISFPCFSNSHRTHRCRQITPPPFFWFKTPTHTHNHRFC